MNTKKIYLQLPQLTIFFLYSQPVNANIFTQRYKLMDYL